jgi:IS4 transposase
MRGSFTPRRKSGKGILPVRRRLTRTCYLGPRLFFAHRNYYDVEKDLRLTFLTNNLVVLPLTIAQLYRARRQVELFSRWIKQHLHIRAFYGTSENAVKTEVWVALTVYVPVAIVKKQLGLDQSLHQILQILNATIFKKADFRGVSQFERLLLRRGDLYPIERLRLTLGRY